MKQSAETVAVWIEKNEWWPVYCRREDGRYADARIVLSQDDYDFVVKAEEEFWKAQEILGKATDAVLNNEVVADG